MSSTAPLVSVVMINFNGRPWLEKSVESVLANQNVPFELIVVDDCSTDGSRDYLDSVAVRDDRVRVVHQAVNGGISVARNAGIDVARGTYISIIDSDDLFLPDTLARQVETFERLRAGCPEMSLLTSDAWLINEAGKRCGRYISRDWWDREDVENPPLWTLPSTFFFRRDRAAKFHPAYRSADAPIFISRMLALGPIGFSGAPLIEYRLRMSSVTNRQGDRMLREMKAADRSKCLGRLDDPLSPTDVPAPGWREVTVWSCGRNAKNAAANGKRYLALWEVGKASLASPLATGAKLLRAFRTMRVDNIPQ
jgi:hypothetical protein